MRIKVAVLSVVCVFLLSACHVPILNKEITIPFIEKNEEEVIRLMADKMEKAKKYKYNGKVEMDVNMDLQELMEIVKFLKSSNIAKRSLNPRVLGVDEDLNGNSSFELSPDVSFDAPGISTFGLGSGLNDINYKLEYDITGSYNHSVEENFKDDININLKITIDGTTLNLGLSIRTIAKNIYFKVNQLPYPLSFFVPSEFQDSWWGLDVEKMEELAEGEAPDVLKTIGVSDLTDSDKRKKEIENELALIFTKYELLSITERLADEEVNGVNCYHYAYEVNKENLKNVLKEIINLAENQTKETGNSPVGLLSENEEYKEFIEQFEKIITSFNGQIWIGKKDYYLYNFNFDLKIDLNGIEIDGKTIPENVIKFDLKGEIKYSDFDQDTTIIAPEESKSLTEYFESSISDSRMELRDAKRLSDIKQIMTALELYYNDEIRYPESIAPENEMVKFMPNIPKNPTPVGENCEDNKEYKYVSLKEGQSYELTYCLEQNTGQIEAGVNVATPSGLNSGNDEVSDKDEDGLNDYEEENIYHTDPNNVDSDGDGMNDGAEIMLFMDPNSTSTDNMQFSLPEFTLIHSEKSIYSGDFDSAWGDIDKSEDFVKFIDEEFNITIDEMKILHKNFAPAFFGIEDKEVKIINIINKETISEDLIELDYKVFFKESEDYYVQQARTDKAYLRKVDNEWFVDVYEEFKNIKAENIAEFQILKRIYSKTNLEQFEMSDTSNDSNLDILDNETISSGTSEKIDDDSAIDNNLIEDVLKDSDKDGLTDKEEIEIYHTDPNNFDTDEDGYSDGSEVENGYNPNGEGKL